MAIQMNM